MVNRLLIFCILAALFAASCLLLACDGEDGEDGKDGPDGQYVGQEPDDDDDSTTDDDDVSDDDDSVDDDDDITDDDDDALTKEDLPYSDECPALAECVVGACQSTPDPESYALGKCTVTNCATDYETCFGPYGEGACVQVLKCLQQCLPADCLNDCLEGASYQSLLDFYDVGICVEDNCPDALEDPLGNIGCFVSTCDDPVATCCGGTILGCM